MAVLPIQLDRARRTPLAAQIYFAIREGIEHGRLTSGARLPSWRDLAAQLGVSRGTVRVAYERLVAERFAIGLGAAGTRVAERPSRSSMPDWSPEAPPLPDLFYEFGSPPLAFQMGVPSSRRLPVQAMVTHPGGCDAASCGSTVDVSGSAWRSGAPQGGRGLLRGWPAAFGAVPLRCS